MENTFINIGGHKVTTNKVGAVISCTITSNYTSQSYLNYCVVNGICTVTGRILPTGANYSNVVVTTDLPKPAMTIQIHQPPVSGNETSRYVTVYTDNNNKGAMAMSTSASTSGSYICFSYPVAND